MNKNLEFSINWGDPREPEFNDAGRIAFAVCRRGDSSISFRIIPEKSRDNRTIHNVIAPAGIRKFAEGSLEEAMLICNKTIDFLSQEAIAQKFNSSKNENAVFVLNDSNIPVGLNWLRFRLNEKSSSITGRNVRLFMMLPETYTSLILLSGFAVILFEVILGVDAKYQQVIKVAAYAAASLALIRLIVEMWKDYNLSVMAMSIARFGNRQLNVHRSAMSSTIRAWGVRYVTTACLIFILIYLCGLNV